VSVSKDSVLLFGTGGRKTTNQTVNDGVAHSKTKTISLSCRQVVMLGRYSICPPAENCVNRAANEATVRDSRFS